MDAGEVKNEVVQAFTDFLVNNGLKKSQERYVVLDAAQKIDGLFTAADLHSFLTGGMNFHLSLATVYSTLELLTQCGITVKHCLSANSVKFEYAYGRTSFSYTICSKCGRISHVHDKTLDRAVAAVKTPRFHFDFYKTYIYGVCAACARKEKSKLRKIKNQDKNETR